MICAQRYAGCARDCVMALVFIIARYTESEMTKQPVDDAGMGGRVGKAGQCVFSLEGSTAGWSS